ncbi:hypothetical protein M3Y98_00979700 [Aphelenchoides besseyi]|nr:hypothetical protein M3Y98_00979700 [Aphelenchoides besseyi]KAI6194939.1 hypothetical protein M3Y96_01178300 [Aphelenchoides besseyi]
MANETQHYARAILLEEYRDGTEVEKVRAELGPNMIAREDAVFWYEQFRGGNKTIAGNSNVSDRCFIENDTFLPSKRNLVGVLYSNGHALTCNPYGADSRFKIVCELDMRKSWMVDTFNRTKK